MESYDIGQWKVQYDDERFREQLGLSPTVLVSREPSAEGVFIFRLAKDGLVFRRTMSDSIDVSATLGHARWFDERHMIDEILFENIAFLRHGPSDGASGPDPTEEEGTGSEHPPTLFETLLGIEPHRRIRFCCCYFEYWEIPADLGHDICFDRCIFKADAEFSGRLTSDVTFERCILYSDLVIGSCQGLGTFRIVSTYLHSLIVEDAVIASLILSGHTVLSGIADIRNSKFRRALTFDDVCQRDPCPCSADGKADPFAIRSCVVGDVMSFIRTDLEALHCIGSTVENMKVADLRSRKAVDLSRSHFNGWVDFQGARVESLVMREAYVYRNLVLSTDEYRLSVSGGCDLSNITVEGDTRLIGVGTKVLALKEGRFGSLFMSGCEFDRADLHEIRVAGKCSMTHSRFSDTLDLAGSFFCDETVLSGISDEGSIFQELRLDGMTVLRGFRMAGARCAGLSAENAQFDSIDLTSTKIDGVLRLSGTTVGGDIRMDGIGIGGDAGLDRMDAQDLHMDGASFANLDLEGSRFSCISLQDISPSSIVMSRVRSKEVRISLNNRSRLHGGSFRNMEVGSRFIMERTEFDFRPDFSSSRFGEGVSMKGVKLHAGIDLSGSVFGGNSDFDFIVVRGRNRIDFSHASFQSNNGNIRIGVESSEDAKLDIRALATNSQIFFSGLVFDALREYGARRVVYRLFGNDTDVFRNLWCDCDDWHVLCDQWAVLEQIYRVRDELDLQKDAYVWRRFCERRALKTVTAPEEVR